MMREKYLREMDRLATKRDEWFKQAVSKPYNPKEDFMIKAMINIANMCLDSEQPKVPDELDPCFECERVVNIKKVLPIEEIRRDHPEVTIFEGVYVKVKGIAMTHDYAYSRGKQNGRRVSFDAGPDSSLPAGYNYGTLKDCHGRYLFALSKDEPLSKFIYSSNGYDIFDLGLI